MTNLNSNFKSQSHLNTHSILPVTYIPALPMGSLEAYVQQVNQVDLLTEQEEFELATALQKNGDIHAAQRLVLSHLRYVVRVARGYLGYGLGFSDLIQEGSIGLMKAIKRFDPNKGVRLVSFAVHWIKAEIHEFVIKNWRIVKIATTKAQRKLFFKLRSHKKYLSWFTQEEIANVATDLGVKPSEVVRMEQRLNAKDSVFDLPNNPALEESSLGQTTLAPIQYLEVENSDPAEIFENKTWESSLNTKLETSLNQLEPRIQEIIRKRWLQEKKATLQELAEQFNLSPERIRQLEKSALKLLSNQMHLALGEPSPAH
jgi:RNA polymerase sigma-32 factor